MNQDAPISNTRNGSDVQPRERKKPSGPPGDIGAAIFARKREATKAARAKADKSENKSSPTTSATAPAASSPALIPASVIPVPKTKQVEPSKSTSDVAASQTSKATAEAPAAAPQPRPREKASSPAKRTIVHGINNGTPGRQSPGADRAAHFLRRRPDTARVYPGEKKGYDADFDRKATASPSPARPIINKEKLIAEARLGGKDSSARPSSSTSNNKQLFEPKRERTPISRRASSHSSVTKQEELAVFKRNHPPQKLQPDKEGSDCALPSQPSRKLFDPRQHDPVNFSSKKDSDASHTKAESMALPAHPGTKEGTPKESNDKPSDESTASSESKQPVVERIKKAYKRVIELESKRVIEAEQEQQARSAAGFKRNTESAGPVLVLAGHEAQLANGPIKDDAYWVDQVAKHRELTEAHHKFLMLSLDPRLPPSLHALPQKYNIPSKLWQNGFHLILERMRHAVPTTSEGSAPTQHLLEIWIDFIQYAYAFYTHLYEEESLRDFKHIWLEQLGDLARYRMAVVGMVTRMTNRKSAPGQELSLGHVKSLPNEVASARIDQESALQASIGDAALNDWEVEDHDVWKTLAIEWYGKGLAEAPGTGRLHHHLALLSRGDDMKTLYHFCRSMTASHPFQSARESILPMFEAEHQARRIQPDASVLDLFVHLHGLLFTQIQLDDFDKVLPRFLDKLEDSMASTSDQEPLETSHWIRMAVINMAACLQYGRDESVLRKALHKEPAVEKSAKGTSTAPQALMVNPLAVKSKSPEMQAASLPSAANGDEDVAQAEANIRHLHVTETEAIGISPAFSCALKLAFAMLSFTIRQSQQAKTSMPLVTPYTSMVLTFVGQIATQPDALRLIERDIPWRQLIEWLNSAKDTSEFKSEAPLKLAGPALPEDWCMRGMEWTGRQLFGKGFWKPHARSAKDVLSNTNASEIGVLNAAEQVAAVHPETDATSSLNEEEDRFRWRRVATISAHLARVVAGLNLNAQATNGTPFRIIGALKEKLDNWQAEDEEQARLALSPPAKTKWLDDDDHQEEQAVDSDVEISDVDDPDDSPEVKELKARRRELMAVIREARRKANSSSGSRPAGSKAKRNTRVLQLVPGYTILVFDTNVILNSLSLFSAILESQKWTLVIPLVVLTELDGLRTQQDTELGQNAALAILYLESKIKTHNIYLKVLTSRGNYLSDINIRREEVDFSSSNAQNMDDIVLQAALWQSEHFVNRLNMIWPNRADKSSVSDKASKVALLTFDMNLRLKAKARQLDVLGEQDMVGLTQEKISSSSKKPNG